MMDPGEMIILSANDILFRELENGSNEKRMNGLLG